MPDSATIIPAGFTCSPPSIEVFCWMGRYAIKCGRDQVVWSNEQSALHIVDLAAFTFLTSYQTTSSLLTRVTQYSPANDQKLHSKYSQSDAQSEVERVNVIICFSSGETSMNPNLVWVHARLKIACIN